VGELADWERIAELLAALARGLDGWERIAELLAALARGLDLAVLPAREFAQVLAPLAWMELGESSALGLARVWLEFGGWGLGRELGTERELVAAVGSVRE
jgi:hypothetical protein